MRKNKRLLDIILKRYDCYDWFYIISISDYEVNLQGHFKSDIAKRITDICGKKFETDKAGFLNLTIRNITITLT